MLVLGLLLIAGATAVTVGALFDGGESATVEILGRSIETTIAGVFAVGAATMLVFLVGVWALMASMGRARRKRAERKEAKARERESVAQLEEERAELRAENERLSERLSDQPADRPANDSLGHGDDRVVDHPAKDPLGHEDDRVVDHRSDLTGTEASGSTHRRDTL